MLGDISFILIAYFGSINLLEKIKDDPRLFFVGGLILVVYGLITYFDKSNKKDIDELTINLYVSNNYLKLILEGFFINFINIGVLAFWLGLIVVIVPTLDMNPTYVFWYFSVIIITYFLTDLVKIILAKQLKKKLTPKIIYKIKKTMGILLIIFGIALLLKSFIPKDTLKIITNYDSTITQFNDSTFKYSLLLYFLIQ